MNNKNTSWKHTISKHDKGTSHHVTVNDGKMDADIIATMRYGNQAKNAALISAAPEMYEALENLLAVCEKNFLDIPRGYMRQAHSAIYKADGRTD